jgi:hypothetical protein
LALKA